MDFGELFASATGKEPFPYQTRLAESGSLPDLLKVPTGSGKTAAAVLGWLYRRRFHPDEDVRWATPRRLVYCLPMRVLVEQTVAAVREWVGRLGLAADVGVFQLMGGALEVDWVRRPDRDAILIGTMDMLLSRAMNRGFAASRFRWPIEYGLLNSDCLWILDEVQLMGNGLATSVQLAAFRKILGTARPCPSLWMSATVAPGWLATVDHPAASSVLELEDADLATELGGRVRARKRMHRLAVENWPDGSAVLGLHRPGTLTLVVTNTVDRARRLFEDLRRVAPRDLGIELLHSRFRPPDRRAAVARIFSPLPDAGRVVVATQVVEAGVDLSAATLVTELAPWGSIVQRLGRCNRFAEYEEASVAWVDRGDKEVRPYDAEEMATARRLLTDLEGESVHPLALESLGPGDPPRVRHVLRRADVVDLFDTEPDLAGNDVDVSRFIRDDADVDVHVFWRRLVGGEAPADLRRPLSEELCPVPVREILGFLDRGPGKRRPSPAFIWDHLVRRWRQVRSEELRPGAILLLDSEAGGYEVSVGWDPRAAGPVDPVEPPAAAATEARQEEEDLEGDPPEETSGAWVSLPDHLGHVRERLLELLHRADPALEEWMRRALEVAAFWHDVGKAHEVFQEALLGQVAQDERALRTTQCWAKGPLNHRLSYRRRYFRHELASALALLAAPPEFHGLEGQALDLAAYLVAAHHGKVRVAIRSLPGEQRPPEADRRFGRGVWDGDRLRAVRLNGETLPEVALDLSVMEVGRGEDGRPSWTERVLRLREDLGPFRLAFLEALLRVADWEASAEEASGGADA